MSPVAVGSLLTFTSGSANGGLYPFDAFARPDGGYTLLLANRQSSGETYTLRSYGADGSQIGVPISTSLSSYSVYSESELRLDQTRLFGSATYDSTNMSFTGATLQKIAANGATSLIYSVSFPTNSSSSAPVVEFDFAASKTSNDFAVVRIADVAGTVKRVVDVVGSDNIVRTTTTIDADLSNDAGSSITALSDGRYLVTWSEYHYTGAESPYGPRPYDRVDVQARLMDSAGQLQGNVTTIASVTGQYDPTSNKYFNVFAEIDALASGGFAVNASTVQSTYQQSSSTNFNLGSQTISLWSSSATTVNQLSVFATKSYSNSQTYSGSSFSSAGTDITADVAAFNDGRILYTVSTTDYGSGTFQTTGQMFNGSGQALESAFTIPTSSIGSLPQSGYKSASITPLLQNEFLVTAERFDFGGTGGGPPNTSVVNQLQLYSLSSTSKDFSDATGSVHADLTASGSQTVGGGFAVQSLSGITDVIGGAFADILIGNASANRLVGGGGNDTIHSGGGSDVITGGMGDDTAVFGFARGASNIVRDGKITYVVGPTGTTTLDSTEHLTFTDGTYDVRVADTRTDLDGNGTSDILLQAGGSVVRWSMKDGLFQSGARITDGAGSFAVKGTGDFDGDGTSDVLLQNGGSVVGWTMKNGAFAKGTLITDGAAGYDVKAIGDFNGDGTDDIVLQNNGSVVLWTMKDGAYQSGSMLTSTLGNGFSVVGAGDFNGDGTDDILLQRSGTVVEWLMKDGAFQSGKVITDGAGAFKVVGVGDFSGDGTDDILLQNGGAVVDWIMQGGNFAEGRLLTTGATGYEVRSVGDYNGDGTEDIALQNGGTIVNWIMHAGEYAGGNVVTSGLQDYHVV